MTEHHVTFIRDSDRTRLIFAYSALDHPRHVAEQRAESNVPKGFRKAAYHLHTGGPIRIPADGDDYGAPKGHETPSNAL